MTTQVKMLTALAVVATAIFAFSNRFTPRIVLATGVGTDVLHGCKNDSTGALSIINSNESCSTGETAVNWRQGPEQGTEFPFICGNCVLDGIDVLQGRDLTNAWLKYSYMPESNFSHTTMTNAVLEGAVIGSGDFSSTDLTNANMTSIVASTVDFTSSTLVNVNFTSADLTNSIGLTTSSVDGATFSNTICPDATNSDTNGGTCVGHLTP